MLTAFYIQKECYPFRDNTLLLSTNLMPFAANIPQLTNCFFAISSYSCFVRAVDETVDETLTKNPVIFGGK